MEKLGIFSKAALLALALMMATIMVSIFQVYAAGKTWKTMIYIDVGPSPIGVGQEVFILAWLHMCPPTANGPWGDRWENIRIEVIKPDGSKEVLGPYTSDPVGIVWTKYTPTTIGTYKFKAIFPGQTLEGKNLAPGQTLGIAHIGDYYEPSESRVAELIVVEEKRQAYPDIPLPVSQWRRPVYGEAWSWAQISGNFLAIENTGRHSLILHRYTTAPETAHVLWTYPLYFGGLVGGEFGAYSFDEGDAYEQRFGPPIIMAGRLYVDIFPRRTGPGYPTCHEMGFACIDLRTGQEIWRKYGARLDFGQIYVYDSPNQHGAHAYLAGYAVKEMPSPATGLVVAILDELMFFDAWTGEWWFNITRVPSGYRTMGPKGEMLIYTLGPGGRWLTCWNNTAIPDLLGEPRPGTAEWTWRPYGKVVDGRKGYVWNITMPAAVVASIADRVTAGKPGGSIIAVKPGDRLLGASGVGTAGLFEFVPTEKFYLWCISLKPGEIGRLLWIKDYTVPQPYVIRTILRECVSWDDGVVTIFCEQSLTHWGYSLEDGRLLWGPTEPENPWQMFLHATQGIAYGKLFSTGMSGIVYCYDVKTGKLLWTFTAEDPYYDETFWGGRYPLFFAGVADKKLYVIHGEHSPVDPKERGGKLYCLDVDTGKMLWSISCYDVNWAGWPAIADGILVIFNAYDNQIYAFGKGPTKIELEAPLTAIPKGDSVVIRGRVLDMSPAVAGTPAVADENMSAWMEYLVQQKPMPQNVKGVPVELYAISEDGTTISIGTATTDPLNGGIFSIIWIPPKEGRYIITAVFPGSKSYWDSVASTAMSVTAAPPPAPTPATAEQAQTIQSTTESLMSRIDTIQTILIIVIVIVILLVAYDIYINRKMFRQASK